MRFLVFQHIALEHPGSFRDFMRTDGIAWDAVELDAGEPIPSLTGGGGYDALIVMGGPMDVWEEAAFPWLAAEKAAIHTWVDAGRPFLGVCLGHQLLADALGGRVERMDAPEVGICSVDLADPHDPLFTGIATPFACLQWHGSAVTALPPGGQIVAGNAACAAQAMRVGSRAYGVQFHVEVTPATVPEWVAIPAYARSLDTALGAGGRARFETAAAERMPAFNAAARTVYENFKQLV
ncbi:MAG: type 1 glutamine amidotransferase [Rhodospirillales bacterium]|nr:type 1 glutamine amidotransferase [Rhodospirillales bacterium]